MLRFAGTEICIPRIQGIRLKNVQLLNNLLCPQAGPGGTCGNQVVVRNRWFEYTAHRGNKKRCGPLNRINSYSKAATGIFRGIAITEMRIACFGYPGYQSCK